MASELDMVVWLGTVERIMELGTVVGMGTVMDVGTLVELGTVVGLGLSRLGL